MPSSCVVSRVLSAAALGYVGASPFNDTFLSGVGVVVAVAGTLAWHRWVLGASQACAVASYEPDDEATSSSTSVPRGRRS